MTALQCMVTFNAGHVGGKHVVGYVYAGNLRQIMRAVLICHVLLDDHIFTRNCCRRDMITACVRQEIWSFAARSNILPSSTSIVRYKAYRASKVSGLRCLRVFPVPHRVSAFATFNMICKRHLKLCPYCAPVLSRRSHSKKTMVYLLCVFR
jgi:hypothetical protein